MIPADWAIALGAYVGLTLAAATVSAFRTHKLIMRPPPRLVAAWHRLRSARRALEGHVTGWRERLRTEHQWNKQLRKMNAHDRQDFCGDGIPRKDWARFCGELAVLLRELRASEEREW